MVYVVEDIVSYGNFNYS